MNRDTTLIPSAAQPIPGLDLAELRQAIRDEYGVVASTFTRAVRSRDFSATTTPGSMGFPNRRSRRSPAPGTHSRLVSSARGSSSWTSAVVPASTA
jgi:hypothetical protein